MAKRGSDDLKKLAAMQTTLVRAYIYTSKPGAEYVFVPPSEQPRQKTSLQKTSHDFQLSLVAFQRAQQVSAERQRTVVEGVKHAVEEDEAAA